MVSRASLNYAEHLLRRKDNHTAIIFRGEKGQRTNLSYEELHNQVAAVQEGLKVIGIKKGDRVAAFMPNCPETVVFMLAATALGAIWSSCSPDFGIQGVLDRFGQIEPAVLLTVDGYFYGGKTIDCRDKIQAIQQKIPSLIKTVVVPFTQSHTHIQPDLSQLANTQLYDDFLVTGNQEVSFTTC